MEFTIQSLFYPVFVLTVTAFTLLTISREELRRYLPYAAVFGGLFDVVAVFIMQDIFGIIWFKNLGIFGCSNQMVFSPIGWTLVMILFYHFFPAHRILSYLYIIAWSSLAVGYAQLVRNVGLYDYVAWYYPIPIFLVFTGWFALSAWVFHAWSSTHFPERADA